MRPSPLSARVLLLCLSFIPSASAASGGDWLGPDKPKHFAACLVLAGAGYGGGALLFEEPGARWLTGAGLAMGAGLGKELYDKARGKPFSVEDLTWDAAGTATGLGVAYLVDRLISGRGEAPGAALRRAEALRAFAARAAGGWGDLGGGPARPRDEQAGGRPGIRMH